VNRDIPIRKIIHCDMDAFYASVEQLDHPEFKGKPVVVGGDPKGRGVVAAASYEARKFGIRSAMNCAKAYRLCPEAIFVRPNFSRYMEVSHQIRQIFVSVTPLVEPLSLDEAYLDVTENALHDPIARNVALYVKSRIKEVTGLTASAGVGPNKFIAKIASDLQKPDGLTVIPPQKVSAFLETLPVEKIWGVGPATAKRLFALGLRTAGDIRKTSVTLLESQLGKYGVFLFDLSHGIDLRPVEPESEPKSRGTETTFDRDILEVEFLLTLLQSQSEDLEFTLKEMQRPARTITLKVKYSDFQTISRSRTLVNPTDYAETIYQTASELLINQTEAGNRPVRLIGISASNFVDSSEPLQLWFEW
jgi:DNA polymerase IV